ncbi:MAG: hypothetical protein ACI9P9_000302 [Patescibacteria group bacterium]|jgi:hypothetical protein
MIKLEDKVLDPSAMDVFMGVDCVRPIYWFATDLIDPEFNYSVDDMVSYAVIKGHVARLGYLVDISLSALELRGYFTDRMSEDAKSGIAHVNNLKILEEKLHSVFNPEMGWDYMMPNDLDSYAFHQNRSTSVLNAKWKLYSHDQPQDIADYIELYLEQGHGRKETAKL